MSRDSSDARRFEIGDRDPVRDLRSNVVWFPVYPVEAERWPDLDEFMKAGLVPQDEDQEYEFRLGPDAMPSLTSVTGGLTRTDE